MTFEIYKLEWILSRHTFGNTTPGIVSMLYDKTEIILKPGSYSWNDIFKSNK